MSQNKKKTESDVSNQIMTEMETKEQKAKEKTAETSQSAKKEKALDVLKTAGDKVKQGCAQTGTAAKKLFSSENKAKCKNAVKTVCIVCRKCLLKVKAAGAACAEKLKAAWNFVFSEKNKNAVKTKWAGFVQFVKRQCRKIKAAVGKMAAGITKAWNKVLTEERKAFIKKKWSSFLSLIGKGIEKTKVLVKKCGAGLRKGWNKVFTEKRKAFLKQKWTAFVQLLHKLIEKVKNLIKKGNAGMVKAWNKVMTDERKALVKAKWTAFLQVIRKLCAKVKALVKKAAHAVYGVWKKIMSEKNKQAVKAKVSAMKQAVVHAAKSIKQKTVTKIKGLKTKETAEGLRTYKLFYISDYEKEASYLRDMSLKGYHFVRNDGFSFDFVKGEPKNYFYLLDYYKVDPSAEDLEKWQEQGWEDIFHAPVNYEGSWHFFRREIQEGDMLEYDENNDSRLELFERLTKNWQGILSIVALCTVFSIVAISMQIALHGFPWMIAICVVLTMLCLSVFLIYLSMYYRTRLRIVDINNTRRQKEENEQAQSKEK